MLILMSCLSAIHVHLQCQGQKLSPLGCQEHEQWQGLPSLHSHLSTDVILCCWNVVHVQTDTHYAVLSLLLLLANSPTNAEFQLLTVDKLSGMVTTDEQKPLFCG